MLSLFLAILVPGLPMADQPHIDVPTVEIWDVRPDVLLPEPAPDPIPEPWATLADCESGDWLDAGAAFVERSARWHWAAPGTTIPPWGTTIHHGGLQFHPNTWTWVAPDVLHNPPDHAYEATPAQQVAVAVETQRRQGWEAWPVCSRLVGLR